MNPLALLLLASCGSSPSTPPPPVLVDEPGDVDGLAPDAQVHVEGTLVSVTVSGETWTAPALQLEDDQLVRLDKPWDEVSSWKGRRVRWTGTLTTVDVGEVATGHAFAMLTPTEPPTPLPVDPASITPVRADDGVAFYGNIGNQGERTVRLTHSDRAVQLHATGHQPATAELPAHLHRFRDIVFVDADGDTDLEVVVLTEVMTGIGPEGAVPYVHPVLYDIDADGITSSEPSEALGKASDAVQVYEALNQQVPDAVRGRVEAVRCVHSADCTAEAPTQAPPWGPHLLALAKAGHRDLPTEVQQLTVLLGPGEPLGDALRWFAAGHWYTVQAGDDGRVDEALWIVDGGD